MGSRVTSQRLWECSQERPNAGTFERARVREIYRWLEVGQRARRGRVVGAWGKYQCDSGCREM